MMQEELSLCLQGGTGNRTPHINSHTLLHKKSKLLLTVGKKIGSVQAMCLAFRTGRLTSTSQYHILRRYNISLM